MCVCVGGGGGGGVLEPHLTIMHVTGLLSDMLDLTFSLLEASTPTQKIPVYTSIWKNGM